VNCLVAFSYTTCKLPRPTRRLRRLFKSGPSPCWRFPPASMHGRGAAHISGTGTQRGFPREVPFIVMVGPVVWARSRLARIQFLVFPATHCMAVSQNSGPVYGGPLTGSAWIPIECLEFCRGLGKWWPTRPPRSLRPLRTGDPPYRTVNPSSDTSILLLLFNWHLMIGKLQ